ncbi:MAG: hypothetical protein ACFFAS_18550 [Promethearchaeota archaeon]
MTKKKNYLDNKLIFHAAILLTIGFSFAGWIVHFWFISSAKNSDGDILINYNRYGEMDTELILSLVFFIFSAVIFALYSIHFYRKMVK